MAMGYRLAVFAVLAVVIGLAFGHAAPGFALRPLTYARHLPESAPGQGGVVYVLGGTPDSLKRKFEIASRLLHERKATRILVLSRRELMAFSPTLNRNLTANEWAAENLVAFGVPAEQIEFVALEGGFFGTWSEARGLSRFARERGIQRLILVTSAFHSRRVWESFAHTVRDPDTRTYLYQSNESASLGLLLSEYFKLLLYRVLLF